MKTTVLAISLALVTAATSAAQHTPTQAARSQVHRARVKKWVGVALIGAGAVVIPVTAARSGGAHDGTAATIGFGAVVGGASLVWWGAREQRKAAASTTAYVSLLPESDTTLHVGETAAVHFDPQTPYSIGSGGGSLVLVKKLTLEDGGTTYVYRAARVGPDTLVAAPTNLPDGHCISCVTQHYFVNVVP